MAQKSLTVNFFGRDVTLNKTFEGIKKNTFSTANVLEQGSKKATYVLGALTAASLKFAKAAADDEKSAASLANTLKTVTNATTGQIANVEKFISKAEMFSTVADDNIRPAFDTLVRATGDIGKAQNMTNLALEIAAKTGTSVEEVANAMAKAQRGQFKALTNLTKIQPKATKATTVYGKEMKVVKGQLVTVSKAMGSTAKSSEDLESYLKRVGKAYKGSIAGQSGTAAFKMAQFQRAMDRTQETLGYMLLPYLKKFSDWLIKIEPWVTKHKDAIFKWGVAIAGMAVSIKLLNGAYKAFKLTEAIIGFAKLGAAATTAGAQTAAAGSVAAKGWGWVAAVVIGITALVTATKYFEGQRKEKEKNLKKVVTGDIKVPEDVSIKAFTPKKNPSWLDNLRWWASGGKGPQPEKPKMAKGGVVRRPTVAMLGEAGPEAVLPLARAGLGGAGIMIVNNIQGSVVTRQELSLEIRNDLAQFLRRKGINPAVLGV